MIVSKTYITLFLLALSLISSAQQNDGITFSGNQQGFIPGWIVNGPFEFPTVGFGDPKDTSAIGEPDISPTAGQYALPILPEKEKNLWFIQSPDNKGFVDFNSTLEWNANTAIPVKIWYSKAGYAFTTIISDKEQDALLTFGSNSQLKVFLNKKQIHTVNGARNASKDQDTVRIRLQKGNNDLLVRVINTHTNLGLAFFGVIKWEWGFYARLLKTDGTPLSEAKYSLRSMDNKSDFNIVSTIFYKKTDNNFKQRFDIEINSLSSEISSAVLKIKHNNSNYDFNFESVNPGRTRQSFYLPEIVSNSTANAELIIGTQRIQKDVNLESRKKYTVHLMLLNHTDVGYTHPQPVCEELHCNTLDDVIKACREYPDFHWTIETTWQLEAYEKLRSEEQFNELISLIRSGRIAVSPIYTNPFTGLVSEEEMLRSFDKALEYKKKYGIDYNGAVYNDVPGQSWFLPQALSKAGVKLVAEGINEVYGDYKLQRSLPKVFKWEAADGSQVVTYINEAYNEGRSYGLESGDLFTVEQKLWERINKLEAKKYTPDIILINSSFSDNSILAKHQYLLAKKWNEQYEYPKFLSSSISKFTTELINSDAYNTLPVFRGDWTSNWDIFYQGEFERNKKLRTAQHDLLSAEKLSTLTALLDSTKRPMSGELAAAYRSMLHFSGHGSGLEYGYGSPEENKLTMEYRDHYVDNAYLGAESVLLKSMQMLSKPEESLDSEGLFIFNTLSWRRDDLIEFHFPFDHSPQYEVVDAASNKVIPSFRKDHRQFFIAREVPSFGYKKFLLKPASSKANNSGLVKTANSIENQFYKISFDAHSVTGIWDKKLNKELLVKNSTLQFAGPTVEKYQLNQNHKSLALKNVEYEIIDESPVRLIIRAVMENEVIEKLEYTLLDSIDKVFVTASVNLAAMEPAKSVEEYGLPFSFNLPDSKVKSEILGGFIQQESDRLPGIDHDGVSIRRAVSVYNSKQSVIWATADARVIRIRKDGAAGNPVIISNMVNNFPPNWNRHEDMEGIIDLHYSFSSHAGTFNPAITSAAGYELNTPLVLRKSWFDSVPASEEYLTIDNQNIMLLNLKDADQSYIIRLINNDSQNTQTAKVISRLFSGYQAQIINLSGQILQTLNVNDNSFSITLKPGEYTDVLMKLK